LRSRENKVTIENSLTGKGMEKLPQTVLSILEAHGFETISDGNGTYVMRLANKQCRRPLGLEPRKTQVTVWTVPFSSSVAVSKKLYSSHQGRNTGLKIKDDVFSQLNVGNPIEKRVFSYAELESSFSQFLSEYLSGAEKNDGKEEVALESLQMQPMDEPRYRDHAAEERIFSEPITTEELGWVKQRRGQQILREKILSTRKCCEVTGFDLAEALVISHIKPWADCIDSAERLDPDNILLLSPALDKLFDRGFISFDCNGFILISKDLSEENLTRAGVHSEMRIFTPMSEKRKAYLSYHRAHVFRGADERSGTEQKTVFDFLRSGNKADI
jgi:hypothetical protein